MSRAEKISVTLTPEMLKQLQETVDRGDFASVSEALRDAVRLWQREREEHGRRIAAIRGRIQDSISDPRSDLSEDEVDAAMTQYHDGVLKSLGDAAA